MCLRKDPKHVWPPRFWKLQLTFETPDSHITLAYDDVRRLGRIRLVDGDPMKELPISKLGFDPLHNLPGLSEFTQMVQRRAVPIKALLLDQSFSAGVGNWVADEVLWHAKIHPGHYTNVLTDEECKEIHEKLSYVCRVATEVDADSSKFPDHWLFLHRWGKGKGKSQLPDGNTISFETVNLENSLNFTTVYSY
jgi:formamidopyrimidine-DNA glycosylase